MYKICFVFKYGNALSPKCQKKDTFQALKEKKMFTRQHNNNNNNNKRRTFRVNKSIFVACHDVTSLDTAPYCHVNKQYDFTLT